MKKAISFIICIVLLSMTLVTLTAYADKPEITLQPQNYCYNENAVAVYTVKANGSGLKFTWFLRFNGILYDLTNGAGTSQSWESYAGAEYGQKDSAFESIYHFNGIGKELNGATIFCKVENDEYVTYSTEAFISIVNAGTPPTIEVPVELTVEKGDKADIACSVIGMDPSYCDFLWYETSDGSLQKIKAVMDRTSNHAMFYPDTSKTGLRYYCCLVTTNQNGKAYSSIIPVTVKEKTEKTEVRITTTELQDAIAGTAYSAMIECTDKNAEISLYFNPGKSNEFELTGLKLASDGTLSGTPEKAGTYVFTVQADGESGTDYKELSLTVKDSSDPQPSGSETEHSITGVSESDHQITGATQTKEAGSSTENAAGSESQSAPDASETKSAGSDTNASDREATKNQHSMPSFSSTSSSSSSSKMPSWVWILIIIIVVLVIVNVVLIVKRKK